MILQAHVYIKGDVIGVGFRAWTKIQAKIHNIKGWVRNNFENSHTFGKQGGVEAVLQGHESDIEMMIETIRKGSPVSRVDDVEVYWHKVKEEYTEFSIRK